MGVWALCGAGRSILMAVSVSRARPAVPDVVRGRSCQLLDDGAVRSHRPRLRRPDGPRSNRISSPSGDQVPQHAASVALEVTEIRRSPSASRSARSSRSRHSSRRPGSMSRPEPSPRSQSQSSNRKCVARRCLPDSQENGAAPRIQIALGGCEHDLLAVGPPIHGSTGADRRHDLRSGGVDLAFLAPVQSHDMKIGDPASARVDLVRCDVEDVPAIRRECGPVVCPSIRAAADLAKLCAFRCRDVDASTCRIGVIPARESDQRAVRRPAARPHVDGRPGQRLKHHLRRSIGPDDGSGQATIRDSGT